MDSTIDRSRENTTLRESLELDLLLPVYHEHENLPRVIAEIERYVPPPFRVLIVFDDDADPTLDVARDLARTRPFLKLVKNSMPGVIGALKAGLAQAGCGPILVVMADMSDDLAIVPRMIDLYRSGYDVVCPSRYMPGGRQSGGPAIKGFFSWLAGWSAYWLAGFPVRDITNNFRLYRGTMLKTMRIESQRGFEFALEVTAKAHRAGHPIVELPTHWRERTRGTSRFRLLRWIPGYLRWYILALIPQRHHPRQVTGEARQPSNS